MSAVIVNADELALEAIEEYEAFIKTNPRDPLNALLRTTSKKLRAQIRYRRQVRRLVGDHEGRVDGRLEAEADLWELREAIPPELIGHQLMQHLKAVAA